MAFSTPFGLDKFLTLSFGLCGAPEAVYAYLDHFLQQWYTVAHAAAEDCLGIIVQDTQLSLDMCTLLSTMAGYTTIWNAIWGRGGSINKAFMLLIRT